MLVFILECLDTDNIFTSQLKLNSMTNEIIYVVGIIFSALIFALVSIGNEYDKEKA